MSVADNLARIRETIGSRPVRLVAVTKNVGPEEIREAFRCGVTTFGENRVQDALEKQDLLAGTLAGKVDWHLVGHLQTNKVRKAIGRFALIHSVDSLRLAEEISSCCRRHGMVQPLLLQVKILPDPAKSGFDPASLRASLPDILALPGIKVEGLMTITPLGQDPGVWRRCFSGLRDLRDELEQEFAIKLPELSMGMSQDWREAISCGATMVRLGRAVFAR